MQHPKKRVTCYIDGFNLYHATVELGAAHRRLKWVNLWQLANAFVKGSTEQLAGVYYFTALADWLPESKARHEAFIKANEYHGVTVVRGNFKAKRKKCTQCGATWVAHEEKQSDVNLAIHLVHHAHMNLFDRALVVTADSDMCSAIDMVLAEYPQKSIAVLVPPNRYHISRELRGKVDTYKIKRKHLERSILDENIFDSNGALVARIPPSYLTDTHDKHPPA